MDDETSIGQAGHEQTQERLVTIDLGKAWESAFTIEKILKTLGQNPHLSPAEIRANIANIEGEDSKDSGGGDLGDQFLGQVCKVRDQVYSISSYIEGKTGVDLREDIRGKKAQSVGKAIFEEAFGRQLRGVCEAKVTPWVIELVLEEPEDNPRVGQQDAFFDPFKRVNGQEIPLMVWIKPKGTDKGSLSLAEQIPTHERVHARLNILGKCDSLIKLKLNGLGDEELTEFIAEAELNANEQNFDPNFLVQGSLGDLKTVLSINAPDVVKEEARYKYAREKRILVSMGELLDLYKKPLPPEMEVRSILLGFVVAQYPHDARESIIKALIDEAIKLREAASLGKPQSKITLEVERIINYYDTSLKSAESVNESDFQKLANQLREWLPVASARMSEIISKYNLNELEDFFDPRHSYLEYGGIVYRLQRELSMYNLTLYEVNENDRLICGSIKIGEDRGAAVFGSMENEMFIDGRMGESLASAQMDLGKTRSLTRIGFEVLQAAIDKTRVFLSVAESDRLKVVKLKTGEIPVRLKQLNAKAA